MGKTFLLYISAVLMIGCTNEVFLIEEPEIQEQNQSPGDFVIAIEKITDTELHINWSGSFDPESEIVNYDVAVNDSVVGCDIEFTYYTVTGLTPDKNYKIGVIAHDKNYNTTQKEISIKTFKSFFHSFYSFDLGYDEQSVIASTKTLDGGFIICGVANPYQLYRLNYNNFVAKINPDYSVAWHKKFDWNLNGGMSIIEGLGGTYVVAWNNEVIKLNADGEVIWKYTCPSGYVIESIILETENRDILFSGVKSGSAFLFQLDQNGKLILNEWEGIFPSSDKCYLSISNDEFIVLGKTGKISEEGVFKLSRFNKNGNLINEIIYPNKFNGFDMVHSIMKVDNGNFLLIGSTRGYINTVGWDFCPHIIKIDSEGNVILDKFIFESETGGGFFRTIHSFIEINPDNYLMCIDDDRGFSVARMNGAGDIIDYKRTGGYPNPRSFSINPTGHYVLLTDYGIFILNPEGFVERYSNL